jgi:catechol 2,3-dioxygenase-like lactoylglutathione lyase family enzyme
MSEMEFESVLLFVSDLASARSFYVDLLGLAVIFEDAIVLVLAAPPARLVLHRNDKGHDERGIFPVGTGASGAAIRFSVDDPDAWEHKLRAQGYPVLWKAQDASWGRFLVAGDPDGRPVVLAKMKRASRP